MFLRLDPESDGWPTFRPGHRIIGYVRFDDEIPSLSDEVLNELMERVSSINNEGELPVAFQVGDLVQVTMSSFNTVAEVLRSGKSRSGNIKVLLEFMGRLIHADVPWQYVQPVIPENTSAHNDSTGSSNRLPRRTRGKGRWIKGATKLVRTPS
jgi:transcription antitermination factor NusG